MPPSSRRAVLPLLAALISVPAFAAPWSWLSPTPGGFAINASAFPTALEGFFVGAQGTIFVTQNGGETFQSQTAPTQATLYGVFFLPDGMTGWVVGDGGTILATLNGGATWTLQKSPTQRLLYTVVFTDALHGFCAGDESTLLQTADGGATWTGRDGQVLNLNALAFPDAQHGFAVGWGGNVILTLDGGNNWTLVFTGTTQDLLSAAFVDDDNGWAVGAGGTILRTSDGGNSWQVQGTGVTAQDLVGVVAVSGTLAYAVTVDGTFLYTSDGVTWSVSAFIQDTLTSLALAPGGALWVAGIDGNLYDAAGADLPGSQFFVDDNQGLESSQTLVGVAFGDPLHGVLATGSALYYSANGGALLQQVGLPGLTTSRAYPTWTAVAMPTPTLAFAVGTNGGVATSANGGQSWSWLSDEATFTTSDLYGVDFISATQGWIVGQNGLILSTTNGGASWTTTTAPGAASLRALYFTDATHGFAVGDYGVIVSTSDGLTWTPINQQFVSSSLHAIGGVPPGLLYAVGENGYMVASPDEGKTWEQITAPVNADMNGLFFADPLNGFLATGTPGQILVTHDGGSSWTVQLTGVPALFALSFTDLLHGFAGGAGGALLGTVTGGEPTCQETSDCSVLDGGDLGFLCTAGACAPCNSVQTCGAACQPCQGATPFCLGGFCGQCRDTADCSDGGSCIAGGCVINVPFDGGERTDDGGLVDVDDGGNKIVTILPDGGIEINPLAACGCGPGGDGGATPWTVVGLGLLGAWAISRRRAR